MVTAGKDAPVARRPTGTTRGTHPAQLLVPPRAGSTFDFGLVAALEIDFANAWRLWFECGCCVDCCAWTHTDRRRWLVPAVRVARCVEHEPLLNQFD